MLQVKKEAFVHRERVGQATKDGIALPYSGVSCGIRVSLVDNFTSPNNRLPLQRLAPSLTKKPRQIGGAYAEPGFFTRLFSFRATYSAACT